MKPMQHPGAGIAAAAVAAVLAGCTTTPERIAELDQARTAVTAVEASTDAGRYAADEVSAAHEALLRAERLAEDGKAEDEVRTAAYLARRHAQIAEQKIARGQAEAATQAAEAQRERILAQARAQEAAAREAELREGQRQAEVAQNRAERAVEMARANTEALQQRLKDLQAEQTERGMVLTLGDVLFDTGEAELKPGAISTVGRLADFLQEEEQRSVIIEGHTDSVGAESFNQALSHERAQAVKSVLAEHGVDATRIEAVGKGESTPVASNATAAGRQQNRRVEIVISDGSGAGGS